MLPTQDKTLAGLQVTGGPQSLNALNPLRVLGRRIRLLAITSQSSIVKAFLEFDEAGQMRLSADCDRVVDMLEELVRFALLTRGVSLYLVDCDSERREGAEALSKPASLRKL